MHPKLVDYWNKFKVKVDATGTDLDLKLEKFYTQHDLTSDYWTKLPYIEDIEAFCLRLWQAKQHGDKICVYSDYDTDAVTATAVMVQGLKYLGFDESKISYYAPDRFTEGYGLNVEAIAMLATQNDLIISVDCGINSTAEAQNTLSTACDLIITDHHHLTGEVPVAMAVVNPRLNQYYQQNPDQKNTTNLDKLIAETGFDFIQNWRVEAITNGNFLSSSVTGVGVAWFCLVWLAYFLGQIESNNTQNTNEIPPVLPKILNQLLPFVAIGTVADCQSVLEPTNRTLVKAGIQFLQNQIIPTLGLSQLMEQTTLASKLGQGYQLTSQDLAFTLSPILNASGRINHAKLSIATVLASSPIEASTLASQLIATNMERKQQVKDILVEIEAGANGQVQAGQAVIWLEGPWNKGLVGLLASRLVNQHNLPCVVISNHSNNDQESEDQSVCTASLRAPEGYHLPEAMKQVSQNSNLLDDKPIFEKYGGHPCAAGFTCGYQNLAIIKAGMQDQLLLQKTQIEQNQTASDLSGDLKTFLEQFDHTDSSIIEVKKYLSSQKNLIFVDTAEINQILAEVWTLDPFGQDFSMPALVFELQNYTTKTIGSGLNHIKIAFEETNLTYFNLEQGLIKQLNSANKSAIVVIAKPSQNTWNGKTSFELIGDKIFIMD